MERVPSNSPLRHAIYIGDLDDDKDTLLGLLTKDDGGVSLKALVLYLNEAYKPTTTSSWIFQVGSLDNQNFTVLQELRFKNGLPSGLTRATIEARVPPGTILLLRIIKSGEPPDLTGLSVIPEYGLIGAQR